MFYRQGPPRLLGVIFLGLGWGTRLDVSGYCVVLHCIWWSWLALILWKWSCVTGVTLLMCWVNTEQVVVHTLARRASNEADKYTEMSRCRVLHLFDAKALQGNVAVILTAPPAKSFILHCLLQSISSVISIKSWWLGIRIRTWWVWGLDDQTEWLDVQTLPSELGGRAIQTDPRNQRE